MAGAASQGALEGHVVGEETGSGPETLWVTVGTACTLSESGL